MDRHYGVDGASSTRVFTVRVGDLAGNELSLANVTLDPARYLDPANGPLSSQAKDITDAWNTYRSGGRPSVQVNLNGTRPFQRPVNVTLNHPAAADDISSLAYNDGAYVAGTDDLSDIFASIITQLQQTAFNPVTDAMGEAATPLTYRDPIGRYMTVREVQGVELFGTTYPVTENADGTYSLPSREVVNPVYGTSFNLGDIKVSVDTGDDGTEELTCVLPADALPVRVETITVDGSGNQTDYTSNRGSVEAQPFRLHYTVGFSDAVISNGAVDLTRVDADYKAAHRNADGGVDFYSNRYSAKGAADAEGPDSTRTVGDAMVTFAPSASNRFYYFQANRPVYGDGTEGELGEGGSVGTQLTSLDQIDPDGTYYVVVDYHRQGSARIVQCVVPFSGAELMAQDSVEVVDGAVATRIGSPLLGNARWAAIPKAGNPTGTAEGSGRVSTTKELAGRPLADGEFRFQLVDEDGEVAASGTNGADGTDGTVTLSPVTYTQPGVYAYTLVEVNDGKPGITYDDAVYTVTTTVVDDGDGPLSATHEVGGRGEAVFDSTFTTTPVVDPVFGVAAKKVLVGRDWTDDDAFDLVVTAETEGAPMPDPATVTATEESPMGTFGAVTFSEPGTYSYLVGEKAGSEESMAYSQALYRVVYEVTEDEATGGLSRSVSVTRVRSDDGADVDEACPADAPMEFVNTYTAPEGPSTPGEPGGPGGPGEPQGPGTPGRPSDLVEKLPEPLKAVVVPVTGLIAKTGDVVAPLLPWIGAGVAAVTAGALRVLKGSRRCKG